MTRQVRVVDEPGHCGLGAQFRLFSDAAGVDVVVTADIPLPLVVAVTVRLHGGRPALFHQTRITTSGQTMELVKPRSMIDHTDSGIRWTVLPEQTTPLGRWLRTTHLDEPPQLANVPDSLRDHVRQAKR